MCLNLLAAYLPALLWVPGLPGTATTESKFLLSPVALVLILLDAISPPVDSNIFLASAILLGFLVLVGLASVLLYSSWKTWVGIPSFLVIYSVSQGLLAARALGGIDAVGH
jgi:hypothetical protein